MNEKLIEKKVVKEVKKLGGEALKWASFFFTGMPDRIVLLPGARIFFAEIKSTGKKLSKRQEIVIAWLRKLGFQVFIIDDQSSLELFINHISK